MNIELIFPNSQATTSGNRRTAERWQEILQGLGHRVALKTDYDGGRPELAICLNAKRSFAVADRIRKHSPSTHISVAITGTDIHGTAEAREISLKTLAKADSVIAINDASLADLTPEIIEKTTVIYQSANVPANISEDLGTKRKDSKAEFTVLVIGHLREEKDPFRTAYAVRELPADSRIVVRHFGRALSQEFANTAEAESKTNPRYEWKCEISPAEIYHNLLSADLLVLSSRVEGAPAVVSEALVSNIPMLCSDIPQLVALLGDTYPGFFPVGDTEALTQLLLRAEQDENFYQTLKKMCLERKPKFERGAEVASWGKMLNHITS